MTFDPEAFANTTINEATSTRLEVPDEGEYLAVIDPDATDFTKWIRAVETKNGPATILRVPFAVQDDNVKLKLGRDKVLVNMDIWLDLDDNGGVDMVTKGKNTRLGRLREALGQNVAGRPWSPRDLVGAGPCLVHVKHNSGKSPEDKYAEVDRVAPRR